MFTLSHLSVCQASRTISSGPRTLRPYSSLNGDGMVWYEWGVHGASDKSPLEVLK